MERLKNRVVIITGGAGSEDSIGAQVALALYRQGASVVVADVKAKPGAALLNDLGEQLVYKNVDLRNDDDIQGLVNFTVEKYGRLDVLVNVACTYQENGIESSREEWLNVLNINTVSPALLAKLARPHLARTKGSIINFSSVAGKISQTGLFAYSVSKAANRHLTLKLAAELAIEGIRVNCISPGWVWSEPIAEATGHDIEKADRAGMPLHPLGRIGRGADIAGTVLFLVSEEAAFITGADIAVDGGYTTLGPEQLQNPFVRLTESQVGCDIGK